MFQRKKVVLISVALVLLIGLLTSDKLNINLLKTTMSDRQFIDQLETQAALDHQYMWFDYKGRDIILNVHPLMQDTLQHMSYLDVEGVSHQIPITEFKLDDTMSGSFIVQSQLISSDLDGDDQLDQAILTAKIDTVETQGYSSYSNRFEAKDLAIEIINSDKTELLILVNGEPYTGKLTLIGPRYPSKVLQIEEGKIPFVDVRDLRAGIVVVCKAPTGELLISSYISESHELFTMMHLKALTPFILLLICMGIFISIVIQMRRRLSF